MNYTDVVKALSAKDGHSKDFVLGDITRIRGRLSSDDYEDICAIINNADSIHADEYELIHIICRQALKR